MLFMREVLEDRTDPKGLEMARSPPNGKRHGPGGGGVDPGRGACVRETESGL